MNWEAIFSIDLRDMQLKTVKFACTQGSNWRLSRRCYNISHLTWQPSILLTASVHNFLTLNKLKVPLCNLTLEPREPPHFCFPSSTGWPSIGLQNHKQAAHDAALNMDGVSRAQLCSSWFVRHQISETALSGSHQLGFLFKRFWLLRCISMGKATATATPVAPNKLSNWYLMSLLHSMGAPEL